MKINIPFYYTKNNLFVQDVVTIKISNKLQKQKVYTVTRAL